MNMLDFYMDEVQSQYPATLDMIAKGWHIDRKALIETRHTLVNEINQQQTEVEKLIGWIPNTKSSIDMEKLLEQLTVPVDDPTNRSKPTKGYPKGQVKRSENDLLRYVHKYPQCRDVLLACIEITTRRTLASNFLGMALDSHDHYHPTYRINGTKSGRYASEGADEGGPQAQNWPHNLLNLVIPDNPTTDELTESDLAQAEDMIVTWDSQDQVMIDAFTNHIDSHRLKGCWIFRNWEYKDGIPPTDLLASITESCSRCSGLGIKKCNHSERFISKSSGYAFKYRMGVRKFIMHQLVPAGVFISEVEGKRIQHRVITPATQRWQDSTDEELKRTRWITNLLGRRRNFYGIHDSSGEMLRDALSWKAQSVVGIIAARATVRLERSLRSIGNGARLVTQRHDSVLVNHKFSDRKLVAEAIAEAFFSPINAHGRPLLIPHESKSGPNWRDLV